jgi:cobalt-zinc-cadmium efflux system membrane fusion protein
MTTMKIHAVLLPLPLALMLAACGGGTETDNKAASAPEGHAEESHEDEGKIVLTEDQIASAGIQIGRPTLGGSGTLEMPATIESDPQAMHVVSAAIGGRIVSLTRNLGETIGRGQTLAIIESREAAQMKGEVEASRARMALANSNLGREQRLFAQRVSPEQDLIAARTAAAEARIAYNQAIGQLSAAGGGGGSLNRIGIGAPAAGQVISRSVALGQTVDANAELYRIANLSTVSLSLQLQPGDAGRVKPGNMVQVTAAGRQATARVRFVSPILDEQTRLVPVVAMLDNREGQWRAGEPVTAAVQLSGEGGDDAIRVPSTAVQTVEGKTMIFVRTSNGFQVTPVTLGQTSGAMVIVRSGLRGSERIATINSFTLKAELGKGEATHEDH